jgi:hypothetical protein
LFSLIILVHPTAENIEGMFQNIARRIIFVPDRDEVGGELSKMRNVELHNTDCSSSTITLIKRKRTRCHDA